MLHVDSGDWSGRKALTFPGTDTPDTEQSPHSLISTECRLSARPIAPKVIQSGYGFGSSH